jgi:hypothetical protein
LAFGNDVITVGSQIENFEIKHFRQVVFLIASMIYCANFISEPVAGKVKTVPNGITDKSWRSTRFF